MIRTLRSALSGCGGLVGAYLFGSRASGDHGPESDVDVGVLFERPLGYREVLKIQGTLEDALGRSVDVVDVRVASAFLALDIIRGTRFLCADAFVCDEFELLVLRRAADLAPFERVRRETLLDTRA